MSVTAPSLSAAVASREERAAALIASIEQVLLPGAGASVDPRVDILIDVLASGARAWSTQKIVRDHFLCQAFDKLKDDYPGRAMDMLRTEIDRYLIRKRPVSCARGEVQRNLAIAHAFKSLATGTSESNLYDIVDIPKKRHPIGMDAS